MTHRRTIALSFLIGLVLALALAGWLQRRKEVARVLRSEGVLLLTTPNNDSIRARLWMAARGYFPAFDEVGYRTAGHIAPMTVVELRRATEEAGLRIVSIDGVEPGVIPAVGRQWPKALYRKWPIACSDGWVAVLVRNR